MQYPLEGIRVLDFSRVVAGPFAGRLLADLGADVVKIEPPDGDGTRFQGRSVANIGGFFNHQNAGKRNISIDLRAPGATDLVKRLVTACDIVIENYRPGVMARLGLDYPVLGAVNPKLIMLSISGYGQEGPEAHRPSYAPVVHAETGLIHRAARRNATTPGDLPLSVADTNAALHGLIAVLAALRLRDRTGEGQHIDLSMMDATFATDDRAHFDLEDHPDTIPLSPIIEMPFGPVFLATDMRVLFRKLVKHDALTDPAPEGADADTKIALRRQSVEQHLQRYATASDLADAMDRFDIPWGIVRKPESLKDQPSLVHRNMIVMVDDRVGGTRPLVQSPYRFSNARSGVRGPSAHRGEHNRDVLADWLGMPAGDIDRLTDAGVILSEFGQEGAGHAIGDHVRPAG
jgi:crotonobetainyl-CoA:carnitine CoA-transferase CaiB-like acyl-CoA transferase